MSTVFALVNAVITSPDGSMQSLSRATDFTSVSAETRAIAFSGDNIYTFLDSFVPKIQGRVGATSLSLAVYGKNRLEETERLLTTLDLSQSDLPVHPAKPIESCVYYIFRLTDTFLTKTWKLTGFQVFGEPDGSYFL
jgi:hypothetical protein